MSEKGLSYRQMSVLTAPTVGLSVCLSLVATYLPLLLSRYTNSATLIGVAIGGEGLFALAIPLVVGSMSDRVWTRWGRRRPFMIVGAPVMAAAIFLAPFQPGYFSIALTTFVFFAAYHLYSAPYQALIPDLSPLHQQGRVQGFQTMMRGAGMFLGMVVAGYLFESWEPLPFILGAFLMVGVTYITVSSIEEKPTPVDAPDAVAGLWSSLVDIWHTTRREKTITRLLGANFLWESTIQGLRPFIMLYFLYTLGTTTRMGATLLGLVGIVYIVAGLSGGFLADRYSRERILWTGLWIYLVGCSIGFFVRDVRLGLVLLPLFGLGGSLVLTLPYAVLMPLMPRDRIGQFTGLFSVSRGAATVAAPVIFGAGIDAATAVLGRASGYAIIWPLAAVAILVSLVLYRAVTSSQRAVADT
ncbi:MAG TPA: MFS transporter [Thermoleophilia bacterium]|nr:MFS transporter [Thermoleophilia bacterium]